MEIKHEILEFNPVTGNIVVRYFTDDFTEGYVFNIDLPIKDGAFPSQAEINDLIIFYAPKEQLARAGAVKNTPIPDYLLNYVPPAPPSSPEEPNEQGA